MNATGATTLKATLHTDLTDAIRERDQVRSATLRMVLTAVSNAEVAGKEHRELSDDEVLAVIV
ncbi:MAG TPA: glutamyl-tRNA amidotransferase, partial [Dermacoccus sp.]|nr:glutamyl-tRNA amidotransferase [Dermacoccus sp.]